MAHLASAERKLLPTMNCVAGKAILPELRRNYDILVWRETENSPLADLSLNNN